MAFNPMQSQGMVQITKRPITDEEQANALVYYNSLRNGSRGMAVASMFMAFLNVAILSGNLPLADLAILFTILALVFGFAAMGVGAMTLKARKQIDTAFKEGYVIEVRAPAYLNRAGGGKVPMWNIGPVSVMQTPEVQALLSEGAPASVVCVPGVKAALSLNGAVLKRGASLTMPPNLASMAQPSAAAPAYQPLQPQMAPPLQAAAMYPPAPPLPPLPQQAQAYPSQPQPQSYPQQAQQPTSQQQQSYPQPQSYPQQQPYQQPQSYPQQQPYQQPQAYPQQQPFPQPQAYPPQQQPYQQPQAYPQQQPFPQPQAYPPQQTFPQQQYPPPPVAGSPPAQSK